MAQEAAHDPLLATQQFKADVVAFQPAEEAARVLHGLVSGGGEPHLAHLDHGLVLDSYWPRPPTAAVHTIFDFDG